MGKTFRGVGKKDREKFQKFRKERQGKRRTEEVKASPISKNDRPEYDR